VTQPWQIDDHYVDDRGQEHAVSADTVAAVAEAIGVPGPDAEGAAPVIVRPGWLPDVDGIVELEDGSEKPVGAGRPTDLPYGYHHLVTGSRRRLLIAAPRRCRQPERRMWGVSAQLYAARSGTSWGIGDLRDLATLHAAAARHGASFVLVNPLHAAAPVDHQEDCPYSPVSRLFSSPLYISIPDVPGAASVDLADLEGDALAINAADRLDRDRTWRLKRTALERIYATRTGWDDYVSWRSDQPPELRHFAVWCAISERFGPSTTTWPADLRRLDAAGVAAFAEEAAERVDFFAWTNWLLARQTERFAPAVINDLAVGVHPGGADPWMLPGAYVAGMTVGAPPDALNTRGQNWGMAPPHPWAQRAAGYEPFVRLLRASMRGSAGIRIDHVLGLSRLWFVPEGADPAEGTYVRYPIDDLLAILALESHRAGVPVIGEDLGTVEDGLRGRLDEHGVLSCRVLLLAEQPPQRWSAGSLASATTHDLPTIAGLWTGTDLADQEAAGAAAPAETAYLRHRLAARTGVRGPEPRPVVDAAHRLVGESPSVLAAVTLEDLLRVEHRPNIPATERTDNWRQPLPVPIEELDDEFARVAKLLDRPRPEPRRSP
jgi:4-alpha-glucanotransferase